MFRANKALDFHPPYDLIFTGILVFKSLSDTETTICKLEELRQHFLANNDDKGIEYCRQIALRGRRRAELISRNSRTSSDRRRQKSEVASWFQIWLETPELFQSWLALRKQSREFGELSKVDRGDCPLKSDISKRSK